MKLMMKKTIYFFAALAMMSMAAVSCASSDSSAKNDATEVTETEADATEAAVTEADATSAATVIVTTDGVVQLADDEMFRPDTKVSAPTILDFNATWCVPCKKLTPAFDKASEDFAGKVNFYSVDIDKNPNTAKAFRVESVPTVVLLAPDGSVQTYVGLGDFGIDQNVPADETTAVILANLTDKINALLK